MAKTDGLPSGLDIWAPATHYSYPALNLSSGLIYMMFFPWGFKLWIILLILDDVNLYVVKGIKYRAMSENYSGKLIMTLKV